MPAPERRELAPAQRAAEKHGKNRTVPFAFHGVGVGLSEQVARLFSGEPVPCPVAGLADALEGHDSLGRAAVEQTVFGRFRGQLADRRQPQIDGSRRQAGSFQNAPVLLNHGSAEWRSGFGRVPGDEILQWFLSNLRAGSDSSTRNEAPDEANCPQPETDDQND